MNVVYHVVNSTKKLVAISEKQWKEEHNSTSSENPGQNSWPQDTQHLNNFHHTGDSVEELKNSHHPHSTFHRPQYGEYSSALGYVLLEKLLVEGVYVRCV